MSVLREGCPQCSASYYYGQAVNCPGNQACSDCAHELEIFKDGRFQKDSSSGTTDSASNQTKLKSSEMKDLRGKIK